MGASVSWGVGIGDFTLTARPLRLGGGRAVRAVGAVETGKADT